MRGILSTALMAFAVTAVTAATAAADEVVPTRAEYVAKVDPICKANTDANKPLLRSAKKLGNDKKYKSASTKVAKAAANFTKTLKAIEAVARPPEDSPRLEKWFKFLKIVQTNLSKVSKALKEENRVRAVHEEIRTERSSNAANNVSFVFGFRYCHLKASG